MSKLHDWRIDPREYARHEARRGRRYAFRRIDPLRTALIVVDMIPFFLSESGYARGIVPNIQTLADNTRQAGGQVCWLVPAAWHVYPDLAKRFYGAEVVELFRKSGGEGRVTDRLWPDLAPYSEDAHIEKAGYSAFHPNSCNLGDTLRRRGIETVLIPGTLTNICCESSARDAFSSGFQVLTVAVANAARRDVDHNATLNTIYRSFGDVRPTADVLHLLAGQAE